MTDRWGALLAAAQAVHVGALHDFCPFPDDLTRQAVTPHRIAAADLFEADETIATGSLAQAFRAASPLAHWRETYKDSAISQDFIDRFGCYCLIGGGGAYSSAQMGAYVVYMPPNLDYPWHHHPAEEVYYILAGTAEFRQNGTAPRQCSAGAHVMHASGVPHATRTRDSALLAYVLWRGDLSTKPVWTEEALR